MSTFVRNPVVAKMESVRWSDSSIEDIANIIQYCYDNDLSLHEDFGWDVGAIREVNLNAYTANKNIPARSYPFTILDFSHCGDYTISGGIHPKLLFSPGCFTPGVMNDDLSSFENCISSSNSELYQLMKTLTVSCGNNITLTRKIVPLSYEEIVGANSLSSPSVYSSNTDILDYFYKKTIHPNTAAPWWTSVDTPTNFPYGVFNFINQWSNCIATGAEYKLQTYVYVRNKPNGSSNYVYIDVQMATSSSSDNNQVKMFFSVQQNRGYSRIDIGAM